MRSNLLHLSDALLVGGIDLVVSVRADVDEAIQKRAENFVLGFSQRAPNATVSHIQSLEVLGISFCTAPTFAAGVDLT
jgi:hypothetical protein